MTSESFSFKGYDVTVSIQQNEMGDWVPHIAALHNGTPAELPDVEPTQPSWATREEALRAGVERAHRLIERYCLGHDDQHTDDGTKREF
ncbi:Citramalate synthase [Burkholderia sp. 8Y]|uniref:DUF6566 family protein n=1 Tax=Burkholderia sp. 8Y TaxID=2653133 RepID=UPI0012F1156C|nr:DUF6566 family protein [Burkholderia sp. 8Y]VXB05060.1 Citramalate synthase [Burkholderia sp. 8Y]